MVFFHSNAHNYFKNWLIFIFKRAFQKEIQNKIFNFVFNNIFQFFWKNHWFFEVRHFWIFFSFKINFDLFCVECRKHHVGRTFIFIFYFCLIEKYFYYSIAIQHCIYNKIYLNKYIDNILYFVYNLSLINN